MAFLVSETLLLLFKSFVQKRKKTGALGIGLKGKTLRKGIERPAAKGIEQGGTVKFLCILPHLFLDACTDESSSKHYMMRLLHAVSLLP